MQCCTNYATIAPCSWSKALTHFAKDSHKRLHSKSDSGAESYKISKHFQDYLDTRTSDPLHARNSMYEGAEV